MKKSKWNVGDFMLYDGRNGTVYGIALQKMGSSNEYKIHWFDDDKCTIEYEHSPDNKITKLGQNYE